MKKMKKIASVGIAGLAAIATGGFGTSLAHADNGVQPVTFEVAAGSLALAQAPASAIALVGGTAVAMPVTTITDGRNDTARTGSWSVTATASDLVAGSATILAANITLAKTTASFTFGTGTAGAGFASATVDSIDSVYTYTPTATLATQAHINSGSYTGTVTQTVT